LKKKKKPWERALCQRRKKPQQEEDGNTWTQAKRFGNGKGPGGLQIVTEPEMVLSAKRANREKKQKQLTEPSLSTNLE
jgi:hypothetical protein